MSKKISVALILASVLTLPLLALAFTPPPMPNVAGNQSLSIPGIIDTTFNLIWPVLMAVVIIMFALAGFMFLTAQGNETKIATARQAVIWGCVGVAVILMGFSIVATIGWYLGFTGYQAPVSSTSSGSVSTSIITGACCVPVVGCVSPKNSGECEGLTGSFLGVGTICTPTACQ